MKCGNKSNRPLEPNIYYLSLATKKVGEMCISVLAKVSHKPDFIETLKNESLDVQFEHGLTATTANQP